MKSIATMMSNKKERNVVLSSSLLKTKVDCNNSDVVLTTVTQRKKKKSLKDIYYDEWNRETKLQQKQSSKILTLPPIEPIAIVDQLDTCSVDSDCNGLCSTTNNTKRVREWGNNTIYIPQPLVDTNAFVWTGILMFVVASIWPPLILLLFIIKHKFVSFCFRENDTAVSRRQLFHEFVQYGYDTLPESFRSIIDSNGTGKDNSNVRIEHGFWKNSRGMQLHTITILPATTTTTTTTRKKIDAVACVCHGYSDNMSYTKLVEYQRLVTQGNIAVVAIEYEGHGLSDGLLAYIEDFNTIIDDVSTYFSITLQTNPIFSNIPAFLIGESMGGAVAYDVQGRIPNLIRGVILICPMCKISDEMMPSPIVIDCLKRLLELFPFLGYLPLSPAKQNIDHVTYKLQSKLIDASLSPLNYSRPMRLATARELIDACQRISESLYDFDPSFFIIHGKDDVVTDPTMSQQLYDESKSTDKSIKIYDNLWHAITAGESDTDIDLVFNDIIQWIQERIPPNKKSVQ